MNEIVYNTEFNAYQSFSREEDSVKCSENLTYRMNVLGCDFSFVRLDNCYDTSENNLCLCGHHIKDINILRLKEDVNVMIGNQCLKRFIDANRNNEPEVMKKLEQQKRDIHKWHCETCDKLHAKDYRCNKVRCKTCDKLHLNDYVCNKVRCYICNKLIDREDSFDIKDKVLCEKHEELKYVSFTKFKGELWESQSDNFLIWALENKYCNTQKSLDKWKLHKKIIKLILGINK